MDRKWTSIWPFWPHDPTTKIIHYFFYILAAGCWVRSQHASILFVCLLAVAWLVGLVWLLHSGWQCASWLGCMFATLCYVPVVHPVVVHPGQKSGFTALPAATVPLSDRLLKCPQPMKASFLFRAPTIISLLRWSNWSITFYHLSSFIFPSLMVSVSSST